MTFGGIDHSRAGALTGSIRCCRSRRARRCGCPSRPGAWRNWCAGTRTRYIFNAWHEGVLLPPVDRHLLPLLDGTRDREALVQKLLPLLRKDVIRFYRDGRHLTEEAELRDAAAEYVDATPSAWKQ